MLKCESCGKSVAKGKAYSQVHTPIGGPHGTVHVFHADGECGKAARAAFNNLPAATITHTAARS